MKAKFIPWLIAALLLSACARAPVAPPAQPEVPSPQPAPAAPPAVPAPEVPTVETPPAAPVPTPPPTQAATRVPPAAPATYRAGIWLDGRWLESDTIAAEAAGVVQDLAARGITDLYVRTNPYRADGTLARPDGGRVAALRQAAGARGVRLWAWLPGLRHRVDLSQAATLRNAASSAAALAAAGFDGVQVDLEPTPDQDQDYLALLDAIRGALPKGKRLGAATHLVRPQPAKAEWSPDFFSAVARRLDQVAVMAYDTYAHTPEEFRAIAAYQTEAALARSPVTTEVLIGVPTYEDRTVRHTPETEPPWASLAGVADGFHRSDLAGRVTGWAIFAHYTTDEAEWRTFQARPR